MRGKQNIDDDIDRDIPLSEARFPGGPHIATVWRWASKGVKRGDSVVKLRTLNCGGRRFTRQRWANDFVSACNTNNPQQDTDESARRAREAGQALEKLGC